MSEEVRLCPWHLRSMFRGKYAPNVDIGGEWHAFMKRLSIADRISLNITLPAYTA